MMRIIVFIPLIHAAAALMVVGFLAVSVRASGGDRACRNFNLNYPTNNANTFPPQTAEFSVDYFCRQKPNENKLEIIVNDVNFVEGLLEDSESLVFFQPLGHVRNSEGCWDDAQFSGANQPGNKIVVIEVEGDEFALLAGMDPIHGNCYEKIYRKQTTVCRYDACASDATRRSRQRARYLATSTTSKSSTLNSAPDNVVNENDTNGVTSNNNKQQHYQTFVDKCGGFDYDVSLFVDEHLYAVVIPQPDAIAAGCPYGVTHAKYDSTAGRYRHEVVVFSSSSSLQEKDHFESLFPEKDLYSIGTFQLQALARAHEQVISHEDRTARPYDIVTNNCAHYMLALASALDIQMNAQITSFVARRLAKVAGKSLANQIRNSVHSLALLQHPNGGDGDRHLLRHEQQQQQQQQGQQHQRDAMDHLQDNQVIELLVNKLAAAAASFY